MTINELIECMANKYQITTDNNAVYVYDYDEDRFVEINDAYTLSWKYLIDELPLFRRKIPEYHRCYQDNADKDIVHKKELNELANNYLVEFDLGTMQVAGDVILKVWKRCEEVCLGEKCNDTK